MPIKLWGLLLLTAFSLATATVGCSGTYGCSVQWAPFIVFGDIHYIQRYGEEQAGFREQLPSTLSPEMLGAEFRRVSFRVAGSDVGCDYEPKDGHSAHLEPGTPVYTVKGYRPEFLLGTVEDGQLVLYEADYVRGAKHGSDLVDIGGKVAFISIHGSGDDAPELARIDDPHTVASPTKLILDSPVDYGIETPREAPLSLSFHLMNGFVVQRSYFQKAGLIHSAIKLSRPARDMIRGALPPMSSP